MLAGRFKGGVHPEYHKQLTSARSIRRLDPPAELKIPLLQHAGAICAARVKAGDAVKAGTLIADSEKLISSPIHSPVSGTVKAVKKTSHPIIGSCNSIIITSDGKYEKDPSIRSRTEQGISSLAPDDIIGIIRRCGIVGLGGAAFPTHVKLKPPKDRKIDTFILNGAECEPYLTCDDRVMQERSKEVITGALLAMKAAGVNSGIIAIEDNKPLAIKAMRSVLDSLQPAACSLQLNILPTKYPQGGEKQLIKAILKREVPPLKLPFDVGCIVENAQTAFAIYEAVYHNKPLYEKVITVTGDAVAKPANLLVGIGTPASYVIENCGGIKKELCKMIIGGPMMGITQYVTDVPLVKAVSGILALSREATHMATQEYCIRCGRCKQSCPVNLIPTDIAKAAECGHFDIAVTLNATDCIECGCCSYVCPSNIPLVQLIKHAKRSIACQI